MSTVAIDAVHIPPHPFFDFNNAPDRIERDQAGRPYRVWHSGWIVTFDSWQDDRPRRLTIERGAARLVLLLDTWSSEP